MDESRLIELLREAFPAPSTGVGIGDDAAVVPSGGLRDGETLVCTVDTQVEGVHFERAWLEPFDIGYRATMAAASDLAAMGARPTFAVAALTLPADTREELLRELFRGQRSACDAIGGAVVGGNVSRGIALSVTTTWGGAALAPMLRAGAREGDGVWVSGPLGLARAGLLALQRGVQQPALEAALVAFRRPCARIQEGIAASRVGHAALDVSDGLAADLNRLCEASGVGAKLDGECLLAHGGEALRRVADALGEDALALMLQGGEDYALVVASSGALEGFARIGEIVRGRGVVIRAAGKERLVDPLVGFDHFR